MKAHGVDLNCNGIRITMHLREDEGTVIANRRYVRPSHELLEMAQAVGISVKLRRIRSQVKP